MPYAKISAIGSWIPEKRLTNAELCEMVETSDEWIVKRTGIRERRIARKDEYTSHMCEKAVEDMMIRYGKTVEDVDMIIVCTHTPDFPFPSVSCLLQERLGVQNPGAIDLNATWRRIFLRSACRPRSDRFRPAPENSRPGRRHHVQNHGLHGPVQLHPVR